MEKVQDRWLSCVHKPATESHSGTVIYNKPFSVTYIEEQFQLGITVSTYIFRHIVVII